MRVVSSFFTISSGRAVHRRYGASSGLFAPTFSRANSRTARLPLYFDNTRSPHFANACARTPARLGISERIQQISSNVLQVQQGSLYPALHRLERRGSIKAHWSISERSRR